MMTHFPGHKRAAFTDWLDAGCPATAVMEENYEEREVSARTLLRLTVDCGDMLPRHHREQVAGMIVGDGDPGLTYGDAATVLLVRDAAGDRAAEQFYRALTEPTEDQATGLLR